MVAEYVRVTPQELARALRDPDWAEEFTDDVLDAEAEAEEDGELPVAERRGCDVGKAWDALRILLHRIAPIDPCPFLGGEAFGEVWSYDRPRALTAEQVGVLAGQLSAVSFDMLEDAYDEQCLAEAYLGPWSRDAVASLRESYDALVEHFKFSTAAGDAMILYLG
ncbi:DUF1877 family protein [Actinomadura scrupuli]|uniref:DUF1877 family protein n=1 Tax=Actinomadura scrupuli TaxID=559629 RepID=UPI003D96C9EB